MHENRKHAILSASGAHRWLNCTASALLEKNFPDTSSDAAQEGTLAHELAELKVENYFHPAKFSKAKLAEAIAILKDNKLWQAEMMGYTDDYLEYIKGCALKLKCAPNVAIEKQIDFSVYVPSGFGTADCIMVYRDTLHIIDFKYGKSPNGRVLANKNPQLMLYALGAYETYKILYPIKKIKLSIVQPRLLDGISEWDCPLDELLAFGNWASVKAGIALSGNGSFMPNEKNCKYCKARAVCRARADKNIELAFAVDKLPPTISIDEVGKYLAQGEDVANWLNDLKEYALHQCLAGKEIAGYKAVEGRGSREWTNMDQALIKLKLKGIDEAILYERKPLSLAQIEKELGKKEFAELVGEYVEKKPGKPTLVADNDKRPAITNVISAKDAFNNIEN